ncbi:MAG: AAA family ATPase [Chloroflexota bacterium]
MRHDIPADISVFKTIIENDYLYIDKTKYIYDVARRASGSFFLSRPRRFGKSLFVSTLYELFRGNRELFKGLWIDSSDYDWQSYPVIRIDFSRYRIRNVTDIENSIWRQFNRIAKDNHVSIDRDSPDVMFAELIYELYDAYDGQQVVILVDEYDKPIIDHLEDIEEAKRIRDALKGFYTIVKSMQEYIRLVFITGISKFSKVSIFSELNNLTDLTMKNWFATSLGITEEELRTCFADYIPDFAQKEGLTNEALLEKIRHQYNGFCFAGDAQTVYNPFSTMQLFYAQQFQHYWFESGTPSFLIRKIRNQNYRIEELQEREIYEAAFSVYDIENLAILPLLFQTGYLTIKSYDKEKELYKLYYPNHEVEQSFLIHILDAYSQFDHGISMTHLWRLIDALKAHNLQEFFVVLKVFFANINYALHVKNEKFYQTIFHVIFTLIGLQIHAEEKTNDGRIDAVIDLENHIYIFEFKLDGTAADALAQIKKKEYFQKYWLKGKPITIIGVNFDTKTRSVGEWLPEEVKS